jgi:hypothetical protein
MVLCNQAQFIMNLTSNLQTSDWLAVGQTVKTYPIGRTSLFGLIRRGCVKSAVLRSPGSLKGRRLIYAPSVDAYLHQLADEN